MQSWNETQRLKLQEHLDAEDYYASPDTQGRDFLGTSEVLRAFASGLLTGRPDVVKAITRAAVHSCGHLAQEEFLDVVLTALPTWSAAKKNDPTFASHPTSLRSDLIGSDLSRCRAGVDWTEASVTDALSSQSQGRFVRCGSVPSRRLPHVEQLSQPGSANHIHICDVSVRWRPNFKSQARHSDTSNLTRETQDFIAADEVSTYTCTVKKTTKGTLERPAEILATVPQSGARLEAWTNNHFRGSLRSRRHSDTTRMSARPRSGGDLTPRLNKRCQEACPRATTRSCLPSSDFAAAQRLPHREPRWEDCLRGGPCQQAWKFFDCSPGQSLPLKLQSCPHRQRSFCGA